MVPGFILDQPQMLWSFEAWTCRWKTIVSVFVVRSFVPGAQCTCIQAACSLPVTRVRWIFVFLACGTVANFCETFNLFSVWNSTCNTKALYLSPDLYIFVYICTLWNFLSSTLAPAGVGFICPGSYPVVHSRQVFLTSPSCVWSFLYLRAFIFAVFFSS